MYFTVARVQAILQLHMTGIAYRQFAMIFERSIPRYRKLPGSRYINTTIIFGGQSFSGYNRTFCNGNSTSAFFRIGLFSRYVIDKRILPGDDLIYIRRSFGNIDSSAIALCGNRAARCRASF